MRLGQELMRFSYLLEDSRRYRVAKDVVYEVLEGPASRRRRAFDLFMIVLVLTSVSILTYEERHSLGLISDIYDSLVIGILVLEYLLRLWVCSSSHSMILEHYERAEFINAPFRLGPPLKAILRAKWDFVRSPLAVIDLLAIIPSLHIQGPLQVLLLARLFKLFRYVQSISSIGRVLAEKRIELISLGVFATFVVLVAASALYVFEAEREGAQIQTLFDAFYMSVVTIATVGYGDITPKTLEGRVVAMLLIAMGLTIIAIFTSIIIAGMTDKLPEERARRVFTVLGKRGRHTIICGFGRVGQVVAERLHREKERFVVIDPVPEHVELAKQRGYLVVRGRAENSSLLSSAHIDHARRVLCLTGDDVVNVYITLSARQLNPQLEIISRANNLANMNKLRLAGADHTVTPYRLVTLVAAELVGLPVAFDVVYGMFTGRETVRIDTVRVYEGSSLDQRPIGALDMGSQQLILFGVIGWNVHADRVGTSIFRVADKDFYFNPSPEFRLEINDLIVVIGHPYHVLHFRERIDKNQM